ncbi:exported hypothetical protein [uncultured Desulfatiglans sp.]|uniref:Secreted protein n=1 Tax=Uncultured Desulfatiglans sp. TaxID=1748965 RepID=A0A653AHP5_UNCDX|nr:exported hypothetical protein [uncultured Desulfatiglans sp.]
MVSIRKWSFWPISASICTFACAATCRSPPRKRLISLRLAKNPHFRIGNRVLLEMVFLANLGVNLHVCLCGDLQVASAQTLDSFSMGQTGTRRQAVGLSRRSV